MSTVTRSSLTLEALKSESGNSKRKCLWVFDDVLGKNKEVVKEGDSGSDKQLCKEIQEELTATGEDLFGLQGTWITARTGGINYGCFMCTELPLFYKEGITGGDMRVSAMFIECIPH